MKNIKFHAIGISGLNLTGWDLYAGSSFTQTEKSASETEGR